MLRILYSRVRHACLDVGPFLNVGRSEHGGLFQQLPPRAQVSLPFPPPRREPYEFPDVVAFTMSSVGPKSTDLPMIVYVSSRNSEYQPSVKVSQKYGPKLRSGYWFHVSVEDKLIVFGKKGDISSHDVDLVKQWIDVRMFFLVTGMRNWRQRICWNLRRKFRKKSDP